MRTLAFVACLFALSLAGCLKTADTVVLMAGGTGTIEATYVVDVRKAEEMAQTAAMMFGQGGAPAELPPPEERPNPLHPAWFEADAKDADGYEVVEAKEVFDEEAGTRTTTICGKFTALEVAARANAFFSGVTLSQVDKSEAAPNGAWKLSFKNVFSGDPANTGMDMSQMLPMFETWLKSLEMKRSVTLPTKILETNGEKSEDGKAVTWTVTYDKILEGKDLTMTVVFEAAEGLELKPFTFAPDLQVLARRAMEKPPVKKKEAPVTGGGGDAPEKPAEPPKDEEPAPDKPADDPKSGG